MIVERAHPRYAHEAAVVLHVGGYEIHGRTTNVSRGGMCADLGTALKVGVELEVDIQLVFDEETQSEPLKMPAQVVWCTPVNDHFQIGVVFRPVDRELAEYLTMFLRFLDDGTPVQRSRRESNLDKRFG